MATLYSIVGWNKRFENNKTREIQHLRYALIPIQYDGDNYIELIEHENGPAHYACWVTAVGVAARCRPRGTLVRDNGQPYDAKWLSRRTRIPAEMYEEALPRFVELGWMSAQEVTDEWVTTHRHQSAGQVPGNGQPSATKAPKTEETRRDVRDVKKERIEQTEGAPVDSDLSFVRRVPSVVSEEVMANVSRLQEATGEPTKDNDVKLVYDVARIACVCDDRFLTNTIKAVLAKEADKPFAFLHQVARGQAKDRGQDFDKIRARLPR